MLTVFGKFLRKIRIDHDEKLKDMSEKLQVTVAYLSAVENGKREAPEKWLPILEEKYDLSSKEIEELNHTMLMSKTNLNLSLVNESDTSKDLAFAFARRFNNLSEKEISDIHEILNKER